MEVKNLASSLFIGLVCLSLLVHGESPETSSENLAGSFFSTLVAIISPYTKQRLQASDAKIQCPELWAETRDDLLKDQHAGFLGSLDELDQMCPLEADTDSSLTCQVAAFTSTYLCNVTANWSTQFQSQFPGLVRIENPEQLATTDGLCKSMQDPALTSKLISLIQRKSAQNPTMSLLMSQFDPIKSINNTGLFSQCNSMCSETNLAKCRLILQALRTFGKLEENINSPAADDNEALNSSAAAPSSAQENNSADAQSDEENDQSAVQAVPENLKSVPTAPEVPPSAPTVAPQVQEPVSPTAAPQVPASSSEHKEFSAPVQQPSGNSSSEAKEKDEKPAAPPVDPRPEDSAAEADAKPESDKKSSEAEEPEPVKSELATNSSSVVTSAKKVDASKESQPPVKTESSESKSSVPVPASSENNQPAEPTSSIEIPIMPNPVEDAGDGMKSENAPPLDAELDSPTGDSAEDMPPVEEIDLGAAEEDGDISEETSDILGKAQGEKGEPVAAEPHVEDATGYVTINMEEPEDTHFLYYFVALVIVSAVGYIVYQKRGRVIALVVEGRTGNGVRRRGSSSRERPSSNNYRKLNQNNLEEVISSSHMGKKSNIIY